MINNISFLKFKSNIYPPLCVSNRNNQTNAINYKGTNLKPLAKDTVSFGHAFVVKPTLEQGIYDSLESPVYAEVSKNAAPAARHLKNVLKTSLKPLMYSEKTNPSCPIEDVSVRVKEGNSIREKIASLLADEIKTGNITIDDLDGENIIKGKIGDIVGARVVLRKSEPKHTSKIVDALIREVENGKLKIVGITSYEPVNPDNSHFRYVTLKDIKRLQDAVNEKRKEDGLDTIIAESAKRDSGYIALHIDLDLSDKGKYLSKNDGYIGEIQILGADVEKLKDLEDFCYKLRSGKLVKGGHPAYNQFVEHYKKNILDPNYPNLLEYINEYTAKAYSIQRKKEPTPKKGANKYATLPTIAQCGMQGKIPPELDFNRLLEIKKACDALYKSMTSAKE